jgi:hypothetical protein
VNFGRCISLYRNNVHHSGDLACHVRFQSVTALPSQTDGLATFTRAPAREWMATRFARCPASIHWGDRSATRDPSPATSEELSDSIAAEPPVHSAPSTQSQGEHKFGALRSVSLFLGECFQRFIHRLCVKYQRLEHGREWLHFLLEGIDRWKRCSRTD